MKAAVTLLVLFLLTGCVSFNTNINRQAIPEFTRILVVSKLPNIQPTYLPTFLYTFPKQYEVCVVDAGPLALENPDTLINRRLRECKSEIMLTLSLNRNYTSGSGESVSSVNEVLLEMAPTTANIPFWKALVSSGRAAINPRTIVSKLREDGIIDGPIPPVR